MTPVIIRSQSKLEICNVTRSGIGLVTAVVKRTGWNIGDPIQVGFIEKAKSILLRTVPEGDFTLKYANARQKTGGRIHCVAFTKNYLQTIVELPKKNILPIFLPKQSEWTLALLLDPIEWEIEEFTKAGSNNVSKHAIGVYELAGKGGATLRIGEGKIKERINAHMKDPRFSPPTVKSFRYLTLTDAEDGKILETILIADYESRTGVMPRFQEIRA